jgi:hypothetical protein
MGQLPRQAGQPCHGEHGDDAADDFTALAARRRGRDGWID